MFPGGDFLMFSGGGGKRKYWEEMGQLSLRLKTNGLFLSPENLRKPGFLMFPGGIERDQWHEIE